MIKVSQTCFIHFSKKNHCLLRLTGHLDHRNTMKLQPMSSCAESVGLMQIQVHLSPVICQCFFFSRNIGQVTLKIIYIRYLIKYFPDESIQKNILFNFEKRNTGIHTYLANTLRYELLR